LQQEIFVAKDVVVKLFYEEFPNVRDYSPLRLQERMERTMEQAKKDHYSTIYKHLPICDPSLGAYFLKEIQVHYDMNSEPEMLTEKF
jgi:hypothetical protein